MPRLSASQLYNLVQCPYRVHLNIYGDQKKKLPDSEFFAKLIEDGVLHEKDVITDIPYTEVPSKGTLEERAKLTKELMDKKTPWIYQGVLLTRDMVGIPDLLEFVSDHYEPVEIKSGSSVKDEYAMQVCFYASLLGKVTGQGPKKGKVINVNKDFLDVFITSHWEKFEKRFEYQKDIVSGKVSDDLALGSACNNCPWRKFCESKAKKADDLTLISGLSRANKAKLIAAGVKTQTDASKMDIKIANGIKGIGPTSVFNYREQAQVNLEGKQRLQNEPVFRQAPIEIFIDLEGDPLLGLDYLIGMVIRKDGKEEYKKFVAPTPDDEEKMWYEFMDFMSGIKGDYILYHYAEYEKTHFKMMYERYGGDEKLFNEIILSLEDVLRVIRRSITLPLLKYTLKYVARYLDFEWDAGDEASGANSILWYQQYLEDMEKNKDIFDKIVKYNEDDCRATRVVKDWLVTLQSKDLFSKL